MSLCETPLRLCVHASVTSVNKRDCTVVIVYEPRACLSRLRYCVFAEQFLAVFLQEIISIASTSAKLSRTTGCSVRNDKRVHLGALKYVPHAVMTTLYSIL